MLPSAFLVPLAAGAYDLSVGAMTGHSLVLMNWFGVNTHIGTNRPLWRWARCSSAV